MSTTRWISLHLLGCLGLICALASCQAKAPEPEHFSEPLQEPVTYADASLTRDVPPDGRVTPEERPTSFGGDRETTLQIPKNFDSQKEYPLVVVLHGYGSYGAAHARYMGLSQLVDQEGFLLLAPNGMLDATGQRHWNATDACCGIKTKKADDVAYIEGLITSVKEVYPVDAKKVYLVGHSNGGFMAHRMACDTALSIAAIVTLAGGGYYDQTKCQPKQKLSVLQIHGTADTVVMYSGGYFYGKRYPGAVNTATQWSQHNSCEVTLGAAHGTQDVDALLPGQETQMQRFSNCTQGVAVDLWTIKGGSHIPKLSDHFGQQLWLWMKAHSKP